MIILFYWKNRKIFIFISTYSFFNRLFQRKNLNLFHYIYLHCKAELEKMFETNDHLIIGYFNIRGKAQVPRLLCEYCNIPYQNKFYSPK